MTSAVCRGEIKIANRPAAKSLTALSELADGSEATIVGHLDLLAGIRG
jgi:hypothetical protein